MNRTEPWQAAIRRRGPWLRPAVAGMVVFLLALGATVCFFQYRRTGQIVDQLALMGGESYLHYGSARPIAAVYDAAAGLTGAAVALVSPWLLAATVVAILLITARRRAWWLGVGAVALVAGANLTTQAIKAWWERPDLGLYATYGSSWPSGHTTVAAACSFALLLLAPPRWRWAVAIGASIFTTLTGWGTVIQGWHRPSDAVGAIWVAAVWYVLVETMRRSVAPVPLAEAVDHRVVTRIHDILAGICAALGLGILAAVALTLPEGPVGQADPAEQRLALVGALFGIAAVAVACSRTLLHIGPRED